MRPACTETRTRGQEVCKVRTQQTLRGLRQCNCIVRRPALLLSRLSSPLRCGPLQPLATPGGMSPCRPAWQVVPDFACSEGQADGSRHSLKFACFLTLLLQVQLTGVILMQAPIAEVKICAVCRLSKPPSEFNNQRGTLDGLHSYCKACRKAYDANQRPKQAQST